MYSFYIIYVYIELCFVYQLGVDTNHKNETSLRLCEPGKIGWILRAKLWQCSKDMIIYLYGGGFVLRYGIEM